MGEKELEVEWVNFVSKTCQAQYPKAKKIEFFQILILPPLVISLLSGVDRPKEVK